MNSTAPSENGIAYLRYDGLDDSSKSFSICNMSGSLVRTIQPNQAINNYYFEFDLSFLASGVYVVQFNEANEIVSRKLMIK